MKLSVHHIRYALLACLLALLGVLNGCVTASMSSAAPSKGARHSFDWELIRRKKLILRDFCLLEMPSLWRTLLDLECTMKSENEDLAKFRANLLGLGRNPDSEPLYRGLLKKHKTEEKLLLSLYQKLEEAYLASVMYEQSNSEAQRRRHIQNAEQDIRLMIKQYSYKE